MRPYEGAVHIIDDDQAVRCSLERLLQIAGFEASSYPTPISILDAVCGLKEGCILMDIRMPQMDGIELLTRLNRLGVRLPTIMMTGYGDIATAVRAMKIGAFDFIEKPFEDERLIAMIDAALTASKMPAASATSMAAAQRLADLSPRERQVLLALAVGDTHKVIARNLGISVRTVEVHRARMLRRLETRRLAEAIQLVFLAKSC